MDCIEAREVVSEAFDRGVADTPRAAEARRHCRTCRECRAFVEGLAILRKTPPPAAPPALVEEIVERGRKMADAGLVKALTPVADPAEATAEEAPAAEETAPRIESVPRPREVRDRWWWGTRIAASAAALVLAAFAVSLAAQGFRAMKPGRQAASGTSAETGGATELSGQEGVRTSATAPAAAAKDAATGTATYSADAGGARYVDVGGKAYVWIGQRTPDVAALERGGVVVTSLDSTGTPMTYDLWRSRTDAGVVFIRPDITGETYMAFRAVSRTLGGKAYALSTGAGTPSFGIWPSLPSSIPTPTAADGTPSLAEAGKEDTGLTVYVLPGQAATDGFALPPGTAASDPGGGNPNWTWWVPRP